MENADALSVVWVAFEHIFTLTELCIVHSAHLHSLALYLSDSVAISQQQQQQKMLGILHFAIEKKDDV